MRAWKKEVIIGNARLLLGDCLEVLPTLERVDAVITSPQYNFSLRVRGDKYLARDTVDTIKPKYLGDHSNDALPMDEYFDVQRQALDRCLAASDLVFYNIQIVTGNKPAVFRLCGHFSDKIKELIIWDKQAAEPAISDGVMNSEFELIFCLSNERPHHREFLNPCFARGTLSNVFRVKKQANNANSDHHKATMPVGLATKLLANFTRPEYSILDPFMGSGTTGVACVNGGRKFTGIEIEPRYFDMACERITNAQRQQRMFA